MFSIAGCQTCRTRKIKCDAALPICRRCAKSKRVCYGMRTQQTRFQIHSENSFASGQGHRPRGPRAEREIEATHALDVFCSRPLVNLKATAVHYYLNCHLRTLKDTPGIVKGVADDFLSIWGSLGGSRMLELALSSMALATFSRTQRHLSAVKAASIQYQELLRMMRTTLLCLNEKNVDGCLLANFFMSRYEDTVYHPPHQGRKGSFASTLHSLAHHDGALAILKIWKERLSNDQPATDIIKYTRRAMIRSALMRNSTPPEWIADGSFFGEHGLELEYDCLVVRITKVRERLVSLREEIGHPQATSHDSFLIAGKLNEEARDIDNKLEKWATRLPACWHGHPHSLESFHLNLPSKDFFSSTIYSHSSPSIAAVWCHYHATRMLIISAQMKILGICSHNPNDDQWVEYHSQMNIIANDLASILPFCHGRFKIIPSSKAASRPSSISLDTDGTMEPHLARLTVWPLTVASSLREVDAPLGLWFKSGLAYLGKVAGTGVLQCASTDRWLEF